MTEGTVSRWLKQVGDSVATDEPLLEVSTDKVDTEIPSPTSGTLLEIRVQEDETVEVGAVLAIIGEAGAAAPPSPQPEPTPEAETRPEERATPAPQPEPRPQPEQEPKVAAPTAKEDARPEQHGPATAATAAPTLVAGDSDTTYVTPLVRKLAKEHDVDLASLNGTGVGDGSASRTYWPPLRPRSKRPRLPSKPLPPQRQGRARGRGGTRASSCAQHVARHHREDVTAAPDDCQAHGRVPPGLGPAHSNGRG